MVRTAIAEKDWRGRLIRYAPLILWAGVVLFLSSSQGSMAETSRFVRPIIDFLFPSASPETVLLIHGYVRKTAHFIEYALLAIFAARAFFDSSLAFLSRYWHVFSILVVVIVAVIDETNQATNIARTGSAWDVMLDLSGGVAAVLTLWIAKSLWPVTLVLRNRR